MQIIIPFELIELEKKSYHITVPVTFATELDSNLIIDTGASKTVFDYNTLLPIAKNIKTVDSAQSSGVNSMIETCYVAKIPGLKIGDLKIENYNTVLLNLEHVINLYKNYTNKGVIGLIGCDFLVKYKAIIDYQNKHLIVKVKKTQKTNP